MSDKLSDERQNICMICMLKCKMFEKHDEYMPQCGLLEESFLLISWLVTTPVEYIPLSWVGFKKLLMWGVHLPGYPEVSWVHLSELQWHGKTSAVWNCKSLNFKFAAVCIAAWGVGKMNAICTCCTSNILYLHVAGRENQDDISLDLTINKLRKQHELMGFKTSTLKMVSVGWNHQGWENEPVKTVWVYLGLCPKIVDTFPNLMALHVFCENNSAPVDWGTVCSDRRIWMRICFCEVGGWWTHLKISYL